jgi:EAL domain-containing protein (putative c-di-GMP-specific phosphodiesterase class I)
VTETIETVGHHAAATIVRSLAGRLARLARTTDTVGRVGEQRLGLLLGAVRSQGEALRIAQTACASLVDAPITTASGDVVPSVCWGAAVGKAGDDPTVLIERASAAMANGSARSHVDVGAPAAPKRFDPSASMDDFRVGLSHGDVQPYVRGVVDLDSERLVGYRGIARWHHRRLGMLEASEFIDGIADTTLASQVDLYVARETAAVVTLAVADSPLRLYTPVSRRLLADVRTEQYLSEIADAFFLSMNQMHLQIARPLLERWSPALHDALASLRDAPVALVLTGVEHLADARELAAYPFHELHIARRLTTSLIADPEARHAVSEIVRFAHDNGLVVGAAGVDNEHDRDLLIDAGCDVASGDLFGAARPANTVD